MLSRTDRVLPSALEAIGQTPLVELSRLTRGMPGRILAKLEFLNPGFSKKDRIARQIIEEAEACGALHPGQTAVSDETVRRRLAELGYSLPGNVKSREGISPAGRDEQFRYLNAQVKKHLARGAPVLSVDTKKKERIGNFKNSGQTWRRKGQPLEVNTYDFPSWAVGRAIPYGAYDIHRNEGFVSVGMTHDTAEFAVESVRRWWRWFGRRRYPDAQQLLLCADAGGSKGSRNRAWKYHLQQLCDQFELTVTVCHYPPGTSKWNKIEHRMFSFISLNWKGKPLVSYETVVNLIGATRTATGLRVKAKLDSKFYEPGVKISAKQMERISLRPHRVHPAWNYTISPRSRPES